MTRLGAVQVVILLMAVVLVLTTIARRILLPYPILLVLGGLGLALVPGLPAVMLDPDLVFFVFLPPILWSAAYFTSWRDFKANIRTISLLALGLVGATTAAVAWAAHALIPGLPWSAAVALGAIVSPPDAVAATAIARQLRIPHRIVTILEGESLVNDAGALVLYRVAVAALVTGRFSVSSAVTQFFVAAVGGVLIGFVVGWIVGQALRLTRDSFSEVAATLLAPYVAWLVAEAAGTSAVLACVAGGYYLRQGFSRVVAPATRMQARAVWEQFVFILNGLIFILIGLQLETLWNAVPAADLRSLLLQKLAISVLAIGVRLVWVALAVWIPRVVSERLRERDPMPPWSAVFLLGWTGMRGIVSLAAALALPALTATGERLPYREQVILLTFVVIVVTLVVQGLSLTPIIRRLDLIDDDAIDREEALARAEAAKAAIARLGDVSDAPWVRKEHADRMRVQYGQRLVRFTQPELSDAECAVDAQAAFRRLRREALEAERARVIRLRDHGVIGDEVLHRIEQELDVEAIRHGLGELRSGA
ncbi:MAG: Na+/H+ antiporter [Gemmatimonadota bacterium]